MAENVDRLRAENEKLRAALAVEQAADVVARRGLPPAFVQILASTPAEEQDAKAQQIAQELQERVGDPAGPESPSDQGGAFPISGPAGDLSPVEGQEPEEYDPVTDRPELAAVTKSGPEGGNPPDPGPLNARDAKSEAIRRSSSWEELEQAVRPARR